MGVLPDAQSRSLDCGAELTKFLNETDLKVRVTANLKNDAEWLPGPNVMYFRPTTFTHVTDPERRIMVHETVHAYLDYKYLWGYNKREDEGIANCVEWYHLDSYHDLLDAWQWQQDGNPRWRTAKFDPFFHERAHPEEFDVLLSVSESVPMTWDDVNNTAGEFGIEVDEPRIRSIFGVR